MTRIPDEYAATAADLSDIALKWAGIAYARISIARDLVSRPSGASAKTLHERIAITKHAIDIQLIDGHAGEDGHVHILVDRLWPRSIKKPLSLDGLLRDHLMR